MYSLYAQLTSKYPFLQRSRYKYIAIAAVFVLFLYTFFHIDRNGLEVSSRLRNPFRASSSSSTLSNLTAIVSDAASYFTNYPLPSSAFGELGRRTELLTSWIKLSDTLAPSLIPNETATLDFALNAALLASFPFLRNPSLPYASTDFHTLQQANRAPFTALRHRIRPGTRGIVIPAGKPQFRFAAHLIQNLRAVLNSSLPIQIAYAGDGDLPHEYRAALCGLAANVSALDVLSVFDDRSLQLRDGKAGWAVKPFAALASDFEQVVLLDADVVFAARPEDTVLRTRGYNETGVMLYHDQLVSQNKFLDRAEWWRWELKKAGRTPSEALRKSKVWTEGYAEEGDSGVVVLDKRRLEVLTGLLHVAWQNSREVRDEWTYKMTYGDKESWWFGMELSGVPFAFEEHYGAVLGDKVLIRSGANKRRNGTASIGLKMPKEKVCGFSIAHAGEDGKLLWYNGSLLKNKAVDQKEFTVPEWWMIDAEWMKGTTKADVSCMKGGQVLAVDADALRVMSETVERAKLVDKAFAKLIVKLES